MARSRGTGSASIRRYRRLGLVGVLTLVAVLASGCTTDDLPRFGWPSAVTDQGKHMQHFWTWTVIAALAIGIGVWGLMFWTFAFHRKKKDSPLYPKQTKENLPLELVYTAIPFVMVAILFYFTATTENYVTKKTANPDVTIDVTAQKWTWDFGYPGYQLENGGGDVHTIGYADEVPLLVLPVDKNIEYVLESNDVIHSFWVPDFVFKRDVFPDPEANNTDNRFQNTIEETGAFVGRCAELCGTYHSAMNFEVRAVTQDVFDKYMSYRVKNNPETGAPYTAAAALTATGQDIPSCGKLCEPTAYTTYPLAPDRSANAEPKGGS